MSSSGQRTHLQLVTIGDFDRQADQALEYEFIGRVIAGRDRVRAAIGGGGMVDVFRATDEALAVGVAIELRKPRMASDGCLAASLEETSLPAPREPVSLVHVFTLRATPHRP